MDEADSATDEFDHNLALTQLSAEQDELQEISEALQRIHSGRDGICEETGTAIPAKRFKAIPWIRFTRAVEERSGGGLHSDILRFQVDPVALPFVTCPMISRWIAGAAVAVALTGCATSTPTAAKPLRALLITGGCCHNYPFQSAQLTNAVARFGNVTWTVINEGGSGTRAMIPLYDTPNWAQNYDVVVHNECFADTQEPAYLRRITTAHHAGKPAVVIHCAMHTYRATNVDDWREFLGVTSRRHDHQSRYPVKTIDPGHPIMKGVPGNWVTAKDELYVIEKLWPNARALATSVSELDGKAYPVAWVNQYGRTRVFGTTYGHSDETFSDPVFLEMVSRGLFWAADRPVKN